MTIDWGRPVQTVAGKPVRVLCTDAGGERPVVGLIGDYPARWSLDGKCGNAVWDIVPQTRKGWVNIWPGAADGMDQVGAIYPTKKMADAGLSHESSRIACIEVEYFVGQGIPNQKGK